MSVTHSQHYYGLQPASSSLNPLMAYSLGKQMISICKDPFTSDYQLLVQIKNLFESVDDSKVKYELNERDSERMSALHIAAKNGFRKAVHYLISLDKDLIHDRDTNGDTPFMKAALSGQVKVMRDLIALGADPMVANNSKSTSLIYAAQKGHFKAVEFLIALNPPLDVKNKFGETAMHFASYNAEKKIITLLLNSGSSGLEENNKGETPVMFAARNGLTEIIHRMDPQGVSFEKTDEQGCTALMHAVKGGHLDTVNDFISRGASITTRNKIGFCPLLLATKHGHSDILARLIELGASVVDARLPEGNNAFDIAKRYNMLLVICTLYDALKEQERQAAESGDEALRNTIAQFLEVNTKKYREVIFKLRPTAILEAKKLTENLREQGFSQDSIRLKLYKTQNQKRPLTRGDCNQVVFEIFVDNPVDAMTDI